MYLWQMTNHICGKISSLQLILKPSCISIAELQVLIGQIALIKVSTGVFSLHPFFSEMRNLHFSQNSKTAAEAADLIWSQANLLFLSFQKHEHNICWTARTISKMEELLFLQFCPIFLTISRKISAGLVLFDLLPEANSLFSHAQPLDHETTIYPSN